MRVRDLIDELAGDGSKRAVALKSGVAQSTLHRLCNDEVEPELSTLRSLAAAFPEKRELFLLFLLENVLSSEMPNMDENN